LENKFPGEKSNSRLPYDIPLIIEQLTGNESTDSEGTSCIDMYRIPCIVSKTNTQQFECRKHKKNTKQNDT